MGRALRRLALVAFGGFAGSATGNTIHQLRTRQSEIDAGTTEITIAAPPVTASLAALIGLLSGRRGALIAFLAGTALGAALGTRLDEQVGEAVAAQLTNANSISSSQSSS